MQVAIASEGAINAIDIYRNEDTETLYHLEVIFAAREDPEVRARLEATAQINAEHQRIRN